MKNFKITILGLFNLTFWFIIVPAHYIPLTQATMNITRETASLAWLFLTAIAAYTYLKYCEKTTTYALTASKALK